MKRTVAWAVAESGRTSVRRVAARTLRNRLEAVWSELRAACRRRHDATRVHQVRVASRRALAALRAFDDLVPPRRAKWFTKRLRRIRRAAGGTRDLDVLLDRLTGGAMALPEGPATRRLVVMLRGRRDRSRGPLRKLLARLERAGWQRKVDRLVERVDAVEIEQTFSAYARQRLPPIVRRFVGRADRPLEKPDDLHRLRLEGKRLRYALEIFAVTLPVTVRNACLEALETMQTALGRFMDHASAADRLGRWAREAGAGPDQRMLTRLRKQERARAEVAREEFASWWTAARRRGLRKHFAQVTERKRVR